MNVSGIFQETKFLPKETIFFRGINEKLEGFYFDFLAENSQEFANN